MNGIAPSCTHENSLHEGVGRRTERRVPTFDQPLYQDVPGNAPFVTGTRDLSRAY
jgi:hypothetical protein